MDSHLISTFIFFSFPPPLSLFWGRESDWKNGAQFAVVNPFWLFSWFSTMWVYSLVSICIMEIHPSAGTRELRLWLVFIHHRNEFPFYWFPLVTFRFLPNEKLNERADNGRRVVWSNNKRIRNVSNRNDVLAAKPSIAFAWVVNSFRPPITTSARENLSTLSQSRKCAENVSHRSSFVSFFYDQNGRDRHSAARRPVTSKIPVSSSEDWPFFAGIRWSLSRPSRYYIVPHSQCSRRRVHWCLYPTDSFHHAIPIQ